MRRIASIASAFLLLAAPLAGCSREMPGSNETAAPNSPAVDDSTTEAERQKKLVDDMQKQQQQNFDSANGGRAPAAKPTP